jgi:hypothetical protein
VKLLDLAFATFEPNAFKSLSMYWQSQSSCQDQSQAKHIDLKIYIDNGQTTSKSNRL